MSRLRTSALEGGCRRPCRSVLLAILGLTALQTSALEIPALASATGLDPGPALRRVLARLAAEGFETATDELAAVEAAAIVGNTTAASRQVERAELELARELLRSDSDLLLPMIALRERLYLRHMEAGTLPAAYRSRTMVYRLSDLYAQSAESLDEQLMASDLLASLGGRFQAADSVPTATKLYLESLALNDENQVALLGLAVTLEQRGRHLEALRYLEQLVEIHPGNVEGQLRYAVNCGRLFRPAVALETLAALLERPVPDWIGVLAYQELARIRIDQGDFEAARDLLATGMEKYPGDPHIPLALAWVDERSLSPRSTPRLGLDLQRAVAYPGPSARLRYTEPSTEILEALRRDLRARAANALPALACYAETGGVDCPN